MEEAEFVEARETLAVLEKDYTSLIDDGDNIISDEEF